MRRLGKWFGSATPQVGGCQPHTDPVTASFLQPGDATAFILLAITQRSSRSQTLPRGWGPKSECNKCALGAAAPHWRPFLSCPPRHDRGRDPHLPPCSALPRVLLRSSFPRPDCVFRCFPHAICTALSSLALIVAHALVTSDGWAGSGRAPGFAKKRGRDGPVRRNPGLLSTHFPAVWAEMQSYGQGGLAYLRAGRAGKPLASSRRGEEIVPRYLGLCGGVQKGAQAGNPCCIWDAGAAQRTLPACCKNVGSGK